MFYVRAVAVVCLIGAMSFSAAPDAPRRNVYVGSGLSEESLVVVTAAIAAGDPDAVILLDTPEAQHESQRFLQAYKPRVVIPVGHVPKWLKDQHGIPTAAAMELIEGKPFALWSALLPNADRVVVCPSSPRETLLQAACLAGTLQAPLYLTSGGADRDGLRQFLAAHKPLEVLAVGAADELLAGRSGVTALADTEAVQRAHRQRLAKQGAITTLVLANPSDTADGMGGMSSLAPWFALQKHGALLLARESSGLATDAVRAALQEPALKRADALLIAATLKAIPPETRPNPVPGKDPHIEMEPYTPAGNDPFTLATGRLFHADRNVPLLQIARARLLPASPAPRKALVASNPGGGLPLLETFSRNTAKELRNAGYELTARFEDEVTKEEVRQAVPEADIFLWEGHHRTLVEDFGLPHWKEPLRPSLVFLQSCLALNEPEAAPLLQRGALAVIGSSTRTYSGSGGALTLAFFDTLLYDDQSLGGSLRHAKNYLLAYSLLKEKRLGEGAKLRGANVRSSWAFTLWGDPTQVLPRPARPADGLAPVQHEVRNKHLTITLPEQAYSRVSTTKYQAQMRPNARLAGLLTKDDEDESHLVPFVFVEFAVPDAPDGKTLVLHSKLSAKSWVSIWDARRKAGFVLITPRTQEKELRFRIDWD
jgi:hypothetical protein